MDRPTHRSHPRDADFDWPSVRPSYSSRPKECSARDRAVSSPSRSASGPRRKQQRSITALARARVALGEAALPLAWRSSTGLPRQGPLPFSGAGWGALEQLGHLDREGAKMAFDLRLVALEGPRLAGAFALGQPANIKRRRVGDSSVGGDEPPSTRRPP